MADVTVGVEEEFLLLDAETGQARPVSRAVLARADQELEGDAEPELLSAQIETGTPVCATLGDVRRELTRLRRELAQAAAGAGAMLAACGAAPVGSGDEQQVTDKHRYQEMAEAYGPIAREQLVCGCHVHVGITDRELAIAVMNHARLWLAPLLAITANSPYWRGADTGYASYRSQLWSRWPSAGPPGVFADRADYDATVEALLATKVIRDRAMVYWDIRPSDKYETLEFRVSDVCLTVDDAVLLAGLVRALTVTSVRAVEHGTPPTATRPELVRGAHWRAARYGLTDELVDLRTDRAVPAEQILDALLDHVREALDEQGDTDEVTDLLDRVRRGGTGAERQRAAYARRGEIADLLKVVTVPVEVVP